MSHTLIQVEDVAVHELCEHGYMDVSPRAHEKLLLVVSSAEGAGALKGHQVTKSLLTQGTRRLGNNTQCLDSVGCGMNREQNELNY